MRLRRKLLVAAVLLTGVVAAMLLTAVAATHLLANRETVHRLITTKTKQVTGATLRYDRLSIDYFPLPHLRARNVELHRPDTLDFRAQELAIYPRIHSLLKGRFGIWRLVLTAPDIRLALRTARGTNETASSSEPSEPPGSEKALEMALGAVFSVLGAVDAGTEVLIQSGTATLSFVDAPNIGIADIDLYGENNIGRLAVKLECRSTISGPILADISADPQKKTASGSIHIADLNLRPIFYYASLPGDIRTEPTQAKMDIALRIEGPETVTGHFNLRLPSLTIMRRDQKLDLSSVVVAGALNAGQGRIGLTLGTLHSAQPTLDLSAGIQIGSHEKTGQPVIDLHAAARQLDIAVAGTVTQAIAGDQQAIRTAFAVAREGKLTGATYDVRFEVGNDGYRPTRMKAAGHLSRGRITIPGIEADVKQLDGDVFYQDNHVAFNQFNGHFQGAAFQALDADIDWAATSTLSIATPAAHIQAAPFSDWLFSFKDLASAREFIQSVDGNVSLSQLKIKGPLTHPAQWDFDIQGSPENIRISTPRLPFDVSLSGGEIVYVPGKRRVIDTTIEFLDGSLVASYETRGALLNPESIVFDLDGTLGPEAVAWLTTILPIPEHLQMKPPVDLTDVHIAWSNDRQFSVMGNMKTAGGVEIDSDFSISPQDWNFREIRFSDGRSRATVSGRNRPDEMGIHFRGNIEKETADRLLANNRTLSGRIEGDFQAMIDTRTPLNSSFTGTLAGQGVRFLNVTSAPIEVSRFAVAGSGGRLTIEPSEVSLCNSLLIVHGDVGRSDDGLEIDLNVDADRLDEELIRMARPAEEKKANTAEKSSPEVRGVIRVNANEFTYKTYTCNQVQADVRLEGDTTRIQIGQASLCGIAANGSLAFSPRGLSLHIVPEAKAVSLQDAAVCLLRRPVRADARFDLSGQIRLPETRNDPLPLLSGNLEFLSENGRIEYGSVLMKIFSVLNITEVFAGKSDLTERGYGYSQFHANAEIEGGQLRFDEILMDGNSLKLTGQGAIDLKKGEVNILLLAAPLKTVDRIVNKLPIINYLAGGSLISIPLRLTGKLDDISVVPMSPSAVGKGLLNLMGRVLKSPFKLVEGVESLASGAEKDAQTAPAEADPQTH